MSSEQIVPGRPAVCKDVHLEYLFLLKESCITNMYGAPPYLMSEFPGLSEDEACAITSFWMHTPREKQGIGGGDEAPE